MKANIKPIVAAGFTLDGLPLHISDILGLALFTLPAVINMRKIRYHGQLYQKVSIGQDNSKTWNIYESDHYTAWVSDGVLCIQFGPYNIHKLHYGVEEFRKVVWNALGEFYPFLTPGDEFATEIEVVRPEGSSSSTRYYKLRPIVNNESNFLIAVDDHSAEIIESKVVMQEDKAHMGTRYKVLSHELCHANVSTGTHPDFDTNAFITTTYIGDYTDVSENYQILGEPNRHLKV